MTTNTAAILRMTGGSGSDAGTWMVEFLVKLLLAARSRLKSRVRLEAEDLVLRQQVIVLLSPA